MIKNRTRRRSAEWGLFLFYVLFGCHFAAAQEGRQGGGKQEGKGYTHEPAAVPRFLEKPPPPAFEARSISFKISARVIESGGKVVWSTEFDKSCMPGQPVSIRLAAVNMVMVVQFTPYLRDKVLAAQQQIYLEEEESNARGSGEAEAAGSGARDKKVRYLTSIQTVPLRFNEDIYYFPLGQEDNGNDYFIELRLNIRHFNEKEK